MQGTGAAEMGQFLPPVPQKDSEHFRSRVTVETVTDLPVERDTVPDIALLGSCPLALTVSYRDDRKQMEGRLGRARHLA
jgi:hypothetical protein